MRSALNYLKKVHGIDVSVFGLILLSRGNFQQNGWFTSPEFLCAPLTCCCSLLQLKLNLIGRMMLFPILVLLFNELKSIRVICENMEQLVQ